MTPLELTIMIIIGVSIFLLAAWITYVTRLLHKTRNQLSQAFNAINSLLSNDSVKTPEQNQSPLGRLHQYKGYVIKVIQDGGGFKGIIYDNSMKSILAATESLPPHVLRIAFPNGRFHTNKHKALTNAVLPESLTPIITLTPGSNSRVECLWL